MPLLFFTPASISYLAQFILSLSLSVYLVSRLFRGKQRGSQVLYFIGFLISIAIFSGLLFLDSAWLPDSRLWAVYAENAVLAIGLVFLIQFVYRFPVLYARRKWEARFLLALSLGYTAYEISLAILRYRELILLNAVNYRQPVDFRFPFYGKLYSQVFVTSLGMLKMDSALYHPNLQYR